MPKLSDLKIKLFTDGADKAQIVEMAKQAWIAGFTTNPSLLKKAGVSDYERYARDLVAAVPDRHISFEVFSDDIPEMGPILPIISRFLLSAFCFFPNRQGEAAAEPCLPFTIQHSTFSISAFCAISSDASGGLPRRVSWLLAGRRPASCPFALAPDSGPCRL